MALTRRFRVAVVASALLVAMALPAQAGTRLSVDAAKDRAETFARNTCERDRSCTDSGVRGCRRHRARVVICRIFDRRRTEAQGAYTCTRLVRLALDPRTRRIPVTGVSGWTC